MADISIVELIVYGVIAYSGIILLISSAFREIPTSKAGSIARTIWVTLSLIATTLLTNSGPTVTLQTSTLTNLNTTIITSETNTITMPDASVWIMFHVLLSIALILFIIFQLLYLATKKD